MDQDGTVSYAVKLLKDMAESNRVDKKTEQERMEEKRAEKKRAEKERQEQVVEKKQETEKIEASSIEELIKAIKAKLHPEENVDTDKVEEEL